LLDVAIAAAALAGSLAQLAHDGSGPFKPGPAGLDWLGGALTACTTLPLVAWRRDARAVFVLTAAVSVLLAGLGYGVAFPLGPTFALFLFAASRSEADPWTRGNSATVVALLGAYLVASALGTGDLPSGQLMHTGLAWAVAWFAGERMRLRHEHITELHERAHRAEREAERDRRLAAAEERARIARDLHDSVGHSINVIALRAGAARMRHEEDPDRSLSALRTIEDVARQTLEDIDHIVATLREDTSTAGTPAAPISLASLATLVEHHAAAGLAVTVHSVGEARPLAHAADQAAYRILQEALTNAARHGTGTAAVEVSYGHRARAHRHQPGDGPRRPAHRRRPRARRHARARSAARRQPRHPPRRWRLPTRGPAPLRRPIRMTRVLIADDDHLIRAGLVEVLSADPDIEVVGQASTGREALSRARRLDPDVVLMDVRMPDLDGIAATRELTAASARARVLILTTFEQDDYIFGALHAGASGFILKRTRPEELIAAVHTVALGDSLLAPSVARRVIDRMAQQPTTEPAAAARLDELTPREREVLQLVARGLSNREIARELVVEESTIRTHVKRILMKLGLRDRIQIVIFAYETGINRPSVTANPTSASRC
jgi:DNA-binding NarL/FixJ family response regulator/signal transduction histidine kinase